MTRIDLRQVFEAAHVDPTYYSLEGERHDALCLLAAGQTSQVFLSERGNRYEPHGFASEDEACVYFLKRIFELWQPS